VVVILGFMPDGTWESRVRNASETNTYYGTYSVSGDQLTIESPQGDASGAREKFIYSNGVLESLEPSTKSIVRKIIETGSEGVPEGSIYPKITIIHDPDTINSYWVCS